MKKTVAALALLVGVVLAGAFVARTHAVSPQVTKAKEAPHPIDGPPEGAQSVSRTGDRSAGAERPKESRRLDDLLERGKVARRAYLFDEAADAHWAVVEAPTATTDQIEKAWRGLARTGRLMWLVAGQEDPELRPGAEALLNKLLASQESRLGVDAPLLAGTLFSLAEVVFDGGDRTEAQTLWNRGLAILERGSTGLEGIGRMELSTLAMTVAVSGAAPELALPLIERALAIDARAGASSVRSQILESSLLKTYRALGLHEHATDLAARLVHEAEHAGTDEVVRLERLAQTHWYEAQDPVSAAQTQRQLVEARESMLGLDHPDVLADLEELARLLFLTGDEAGGVRVTRERLVRLERRLVHLEREHGAEAPQLVDPLEELARLAAFHDRPSDAVSLYERAVALIDSDPARAGPFSVSIRLDLADQLYAVGRSGEASDLVEHSERDFRARVQSLSDSRAQSLAVAWVTHYDHLVRHHQEREALDRAEELHQEALAILGQLPATDAIRLFTMMTRLELAETLDADGRPDEATEQIASAVQAGALEFLGSTASSIRGLGITAEADEIDEQIAEIRDRLGMQPN